MLKIKDKTEINIFGLARNYSYLHTVLLKIPQMVRDFPPLVGLEWVEILGSNKMPFPWWIRLEDLNICQKVHKVWERMVTCLITIYIRDVCIICSKLIIYDYCVFLRLFKFIKKIEFDASILNTFVNYLFFYYIFYIWNYFF